MIFAYKVQAPDTKEVLWVGVSKSKNYCKNSWKTPSRHNTGRVKTLVDSLVARGLMPLVSIEVFETKEEALSWVQQQKAYLTVSQRGFKFEAKIRDMVENYPDISDSNIAKALGCSERTVKRSLALLKESGKIQIVIYKTLQPDGSYIKTRRLCNTKR